MKHTTILLIAFSALSCFLHAKGAHFIVANDSIESNSSILQDTNNTNSNTSSINNALAITVESLQKQIDGNNARISVLRDSISLLKTTEKSLRQEIETYKKDKESALNEKRSWEDKYNNLSRNISRLDALVYKQCLLYPLEARYDSTSIKEALTVVSSFADLPVQASNNFQNYRSTYEPLLRNYKSYNDELVGFLENKLATIRLTGGVVRSAHKDKFRNELIQLAYYKQYYLDRNKKPYRSILYLDQAIDKFIDLIKSNNVIDAELERLINSLKPKNHEE